MIERDFDALVEALERIVKGNGPPQAVLSQVKDTIERAKAGGNVDSDLAVPTFRREPPPPTTNGLIEALRDAAMKIRGAPGDNTTQKAPREVTPPAVQQPLVLPHGLRAAAFQRCFPFYAKYFTYLTHKTSLLKRSKPAFTSGFTPDALHFALCNPLGNFFIYCLPDDLDDGPSLKFSGTLPTDSHYFVTLNNNWLVLTSSAGLMHVISLATGKTLWTHTLKFGVRALAISSGGSYIAVSMATLDRNGEPESMVLLLCPDTGAEGDLAFKHVAEITFISPYRDPVKNLAFSPDELYLLCATDLESRFFTVSLIDPREPRLVTRSSRKIPHEDPDYEGITSVCFFPRRSGLVVTSVAQNSPPIVVDPRLNQLSNNPESNALPSLSSSSSRSQSQVLLRADKIGSTIHNAVVSPWENAIAFLDKSGLVYIMHWPRSMDHSKKCAVVFELAGASNHTTAASLQFSEDGTVLYAVDRKGALHIADFGAGTPQSAGITRLRVLS